MSAWSVVLVAGVWLLVAAVAASAWRCARGHLPPRLFAYHAVAAFVIVVGVASRTAVEPGVRDSLLWAFLVGVIVAGFVGAWARRGEAAITDADRSR